MRTAVVTGASSGIGEATARRLAAEGFSVVVGARRLDRCEALAGEIGGMALPLDVTDPASVAAFCEAVPSCDVLVNNAGGALGLAPVAEADEEQWREMYDANVLGVMRMTKALLPKLEAGGDGHVSSSARSPACGRTRAGRATRRPSTRWRRYGRHCGWSCWAGRCG